MKTTTEEARIARTESIFRHVNEGIAETAEFFGSEQTEFVCECADPECQHRFEVPLDEYDDVRADGTQFVVADGHEEPGYERIVERRRGYSVVQKVGRTLEGLVRRADPRSNSA